MSAFWPEPEHQYLTKRIAENGQKPLVKQPPNHERCGYVATGLKKTPRQFRVLVINRYDYELNLSIANPK